MPNDRKKQLTIFKKCVLCRIVLYPFEGFYYFSSHLLGFYPSGRDGTGL